MPQEVTVGNRRPNDEIDKMGIWSKHNNQKFETGYDQINGFGSMTKMEKKLKQSEEKENDSSK